MRTAQESHGALVVHTLDEAAAILRVKESWLERQAAARKIPFTMLGGAYHFTTEHLAAIVRIHEKTPATAASADEPGGDVRTRLPRIQADVLALAPLRPRPRQAGPRKIA